jgi:mono/diheme cytochrome c family protein
MRGEAMAGRGRLAGGAALALLVACTAPPAGGPGPDRANTAGEPELRERGAYVARAANCMSCHTAEGAEPYSGGRSFNTPLGVFLSANITPDRDTGIGAWSEDEFAAAVRQGVRPDGSLLYPVMPTENYAHMTDADVRALWAYLRSARPVRNAVPDHRLSPPLNLRASVGVWRALFFEPAPYAPRADRSPSWNRGAYLVEALGHCAACHSPRNRMGAIDPRRHLAGGTGDWPAPDISSGPHSAVAEWSADELARYLRTGETEHAIAAGPMAQVIRDGLAHLTAADARAIADYLKDLPDAVRAPMPAAPAGTSPRRRASRTP